MKPFLDPFPFRNPENRSSIGEVIAEIVNGELKAAEAQDLKELPGAEGEGVDHELDEGLLAKAGAAISKKWKSVKDDYADWRAVRAQIKQTKKELASVKKEIATADSARDVWAWGKIKELNAQLERLKNEEKERLKAEKGATVREGVVVESHTRAQLEKMTTTRLRELKKKYEGLVVKGDRDAARELADIRGLLRAKGAGSVLDEATEGDTHGGGATSVKRKTPPATAKKFRGVPAPVVGVPTTPRGASPLKVSEACWTGYTARGLKRKGNRMVPDCVKEATPCETAALARLKAANTEDLKDAPGAAGKAAHKRLHKTIGKIVKP